MDGVIAKCVDWGYAPWALGADVHQSCTRLARADYCGDGRPWTLDGTTIDAYDVLGVQARLGDPSFGFEAAWGEHGAICVNETRRKPAVSIMVANAFGLGNLRIDSTGY